MTREELESQIKEIFIKEFRVPAASLKPEAHLFTDLGLDSIDAIDMAVWLESKTGLKLNVLELKSIRTFEDVINVIYTKMEKNKK